MVCEERTKHAKQGGSQRSSKPKVVKIVRRRSRRKRTGELPKSLVQSVTNGFGSSSLAGLSKTTSIRSNRVDPALSGNAAESSNNRQQSIRLTSVKIASRTHSPSVQSQSLKNIKTEDLEEHSKDCWSLDLKDETSNKESEENQTASTTITIPSQNVTHNSVSMNNRTDSRLITSSLDQWHFRRTPSTALKKQKKKKRKISSDFCRYSRLCIFCSVIGVILLATILAAVLLSVLTSSHTTNKITTVTTTTVTTETSTTTTTETSTTTTTETTTITYVPTGIYALQIPPCATWNGTGITVAGNPNGTAGTDTRSLNATVSVFVDNNYTLYVCDRENHRIMKYEVNATTGTVVAGTGMPGSGPTELYEPKGLAVDQMGAVIVADSSNYRIQRFPLGSLVGTTIASNSSSNLLGQTRDLNIDVNNGICVTDSDYSRILKFYPNNGVGVILAGSSGPGIGADQLREPYGNFIDGNKTLYIADFGNHRVQMWLHGATNGTTVAGVTNSSGSTLMRLKSPRAVIVDNNGYIYIADSGNHRIVRWTGNYSAGGTCIVGCTGSNGIGATQLRSPRDIKFDASGNLYVSDQGNHRVQKFLIQTPPDNNCTAVISG